MMRGLLIPALAIALTAHAARAANALDCYEPTASGDLSNLALGTVTGGKANLMANRSDKGECPSASAACRRRAFLLDGNQVVFDMTVAKGGYVCTAFLDARGKETDGWLPATAVTPTPVAPAWIGHWSRDTSGEIDIKRASDTTIHLTGHATWGEGAWTNIGEIEATLHPARPVQDFAIVDDGKQVAYEKAGQYDCAVKLKQLGPYLFVTDNNNCGGANVSFGGLYEKR